MESTASRCLRENFYELVQVIAADDALLQHLREAKISLVDSSTKLEAGNSGQAVGIINLVKVLVEVRPDAFSCFINELERSRQSSVRPLVAKMRKETGISCNGMPCAESDTLHTNSRKEFKTSSSKGSLYASSAKGESAVCTQCGMIQEHKVNKAVQRVATKSATNTEKFSCIECLLIDLKDIKAKVTEEDEDGAI